MSDGSARDIIERLGLSRHPEGGWYRETFRDEEGGERGYSTAIYYLLEQGDVSRWHRVRDATEVWHFYAGSPLALTLSRDGHETITRRLGPDILAGEEPQVIVPAGWWQKAVPLGAYSLVGCTVAPGFVFIQFELAPDDWEPGSPADSSYD